MSTVCKRPVMSTACESVDVVCVRVRMCSCVSCVCMYQRAKIQGIHARYVRKEEPCTSVIIVVRVTMRSALLKILWTSLTCGMCRQTDIGKLLLSVGLCMYG